MAENKAGTCAYPGCDCPVEKGKRYCSFVRWIVTQLGALPSSSTLKTIRQCELRPRRVVGYFDVRGRIHQQKCTTEPTASN
jgi:hypothetical protein